MRAIPREVADAFVRDADDAYALGLWCADKYWWSSSIGISNVEPELVLWFGAHLAKILSPDRLRLRVYEVPGDAPDARVLSLTSKISIRPAFKMRRTAYHVYVNSRPLVRRFFYRSESLDAVPAKYLGPYFAGRFDGDGTWGKTPRISYTTKREAELDQSLLKRADVSKTSLLFYETASEYCIYIHVADQGKFKRLIQPFSWKANRRVTL